MSSKKDKLIEEAQRLALRGQLDKAIKAYEQFLALDPGAINQRQRLAELLVKAGRIDGARSEFDTIGKYYSSNGFYLKAIAIYKKLQVMFPGDISITLTLAGLNEKYGLTANAIVEYKQVYDYYEQSGDAAEALKILEKMSKVDQKNVAIMLKLGEAYYQAGNKEESYIVFSRLAALLQERSDIAGFNKLSVRIKQLFPERTDFMIEVLADQVDGDSTSIVTAVNSIQAMLRNNPHEKRLWDLIIKAYERLQQPLRVKVALQHYLKFFPEEFSAQKSLINLHIEDRDLAGSIELLNRYEQSFVAKSAFTELIAIYKALDLLDPINVPLLEGLQRAYHGAGDEENATLIKQKLDSLQTFSSKHPKVSEPEQEADAFFEEPVADQVPEDVQADVPLSGTEQKKAPFEDELEEFVFSDDEDIEIEVELDDESSFAELDLDETSAAETEDAWLDTVDDVFDSIVESPRSVKFGNDIDLSDAQSHYDLGVAFKEMELFDEAISEFRQASIDPDRRVACLILQAACFRGKGDEDKAESVLRGLLKPGLGLDDVCAIKYDLALACYALGKKEEADDLLVEIDAANPGFRDVSSRLDASGKEHALDFSDEDLQGFDLK